MYNNNRLTIVHNTFLFSNYYKYFTFPSSSLISKLTSKIKISVELFLLCISKVTLELNSDDVELEVNFDSF